MFGMGLTLLNRSADSSAANSDDFSTNTLASYTEYAEASANWAISGGFLTATTGTQSILTRNGVSFADGEASCVILETDHGGLALRLQDNNNYYVAVIADGSSSATGFRNSVRLFKKVSGTYTQIGATTSIPTFTRGVPTTLSFSALGSTLTVKVNGTNYITQSDSSITSGGRCGVRIGAAGTHKWDSFSYP